MWRSYEDKQVHFWQITFQRQIPFTALTTDEFPLCFTEHVFVQTQDQTMRRIEQNEGIPLKS